MGEFNQNTKENEDNKPKSKNNYYLCKFPYEDFNVFYPLIDNRREIPTDGADAIPFLKQVFGSEEGKIRFDGFEYSFEGTKVGCEINFHLDGKIYYFKFTFTWNGREVYSLEVSANGRDVISRILCGREKESLYAVLILCLAIRFGIMKYKIISLRWETYEEFLDTAARLEKYLLNLHGRRHKTLYFSEYLLDKIDIGSLKNHLISWEKPTDAILSWKIDLHSWNIAVSELLKEILLEEKKKNNDKLEELNLLIAKEILRRADRFPLLAIILKVRKGDSEQTTNVISLLKQVCRITLTEISENEKNSKKSLEIAWRKYAEVNVEIEPIISSVFRRISTVYDSFLKETSRCYTKHDVTLFLSFLAAKLTDQPEHVCSGDEKTEYCREFTKTVYASEDSAAAEEIWRDALHLNFIIHAKNGYKFQHKELRLVFLGIWHFGCVLLNTLTHEKRKMILEDLCRIAGDASVGNRRMQEKAIALLSYYLVESAEMTGIQRDQIFRAAYSRDMYSIQENLWEYLRESCPFYKKTVAESLEQACTFDEEQQYARQDPNYIFLGWDVGNTSNRHKKFLRDSCRFQHQSWFGNSARGWNYEEVFRSIETAVKKLEEDNKDDVLYYVYGLNLLFLSLSNIRLRRCDAHFRMEKDVENMIIENRDFLLKAAVLCDFMTRKYNSVYNTCDSRRWKTDLFLLSGGVRFLCLYNDLLAAAEVSMSPDMTEAYQCWYASESGRWKVLMTRLLAYTDFFEKTGAEYVGEEEYRSEDFLEYDHLPKTYDEFINSIKNKSDESEQK